MHLADRVLGAAFPTSGDKEKKQITSKTLRCQTFQTFEDKKSDINALRKKKKNPKYSLSHNSSMEQVVYMYMYKKYQTLL